MRPITIILSASLILVGCVASEESNDTRPQTTMTAPEQWTPMVMKRHEDDAKPTDNATGPWQPIVWKGESNAAVKPDDAKVVATTTAVSKGSVKPTQAPEPETWQPKIWKSESAAATEANSATISAAMTYINRGLDYFQEGQYDRAIADYDTAISLNPNSITAFVNRGIAHVHQGRLKLALRDYQRAYDLGYRKNWVVEALKQNSSPP